MLKAECGETPRRPWLLCALLACDGFPAEILPFISPSRLADSGKERRNAAENIFSLAKKGWLPNFRNNGWSEPTHNRDEVRGEGLKRGIDGSQWIPPPTHLLHATLPIKLFWSSALWLLFSCVCCLYLRDTKCGIISAVSKATFYIYSSVWLSIFCLFLPLFRFYPRSEGLNWSRSSQLAVLNISLLK